MTRTNDWVPQWAKKVVWYQILPERFRNGNPSVQPALADLKGAWPHDLDSPWQLHPWTADWYELQPYEKANGRGLWFNLVRRRYGGDLQGIIDKLDYLHDLGVTGLYLNPVFQSPSHHKYDGTLYHHIDCTFGPDPEGDRALMAGETLDDPSTWTWTAADRLALKLIQEVHARGMRIIFDGVFNHVSVDSPFFRDVVEHQQNSRYSDWFAVQSWQDPQQGTRFSCKSWFGVPEMPEWRQDENGAVQGPRQYIFDVTRRWMAPHGDPQAGIDGWRLDVANCVAHGFWKDWRAHVKAISPDAYLTGEVIDTIEALQPYLQGDEFDAVMNYNLAFACSEYFIDQSKRISTTQFDALLRELRQAFDPCVSYVQQNLLDSHDTNRVASHIANPDGVAYRDWARYHPASKLARNPHYDPRKPTAAEYEIQKLMALFQMTYVGAPMIYYGDEVGMWGANDPCCRKPMVWDDLTYAPEICLPNGSQRATPEGVAVNADLLQTYKKLIHLRHSYPALSLGDFQTLLADDERQIYVFRRSYEDQRLIVALNNQRQSQQLALELPPVVTVVDVLNGRTYNGQAGAVTLELRPLWGVVLQA